MKKYIMVALLALCNVNLYAKEEQTKVLDKFELDRYTTVYTICKNGFSYTVVYGHNTVAITQDYKPAKFISHPSQPIKCE